MKKLYVGNLPFSATEAQVRELFGKHGDVASVVMGGDAGESFPDDLRDDAGLASAAFIFPLPHTATLRSRTNMPVTIDAVLTS